MYYSALDVLKNEKSNLIDKCVTYVTTNYPSRTEEPTKCSRDVEYIIDACIDDLTNGDSLRTTYMANKFWSRGDRQLVTTNVELEVYDYLTDQVVALLDTPFAEPIKWANVNDRFAQLISDVKTTITEGPTYTIGTWDYICNNRIMTFNWTTQVPEKRLIDEILRELHEFVPSKQKRVRYNIDVISNADADLRYTIYNGTMADASKPDTSRFNPQVLAPWLLVLSVRYESNVENYSNDWFEKEASLDIGLASQYIAMSAISKGLNVGFCQCIQNRDEMTTILGRYPILYLGVGYKDPSETYFCPVRQKMVRIPNRNNDTKPLLTEYVRYL